MAKPLAQRANAAADTYVFRSPAPSSAASLPSPPRADSPPPAESRSHAPAPAPLIVDLPASYFPQPPGDEGETQRRGPGVARPLVPGAEPPPFKPPPTFFQGSGRSAAPAPPIMMTPLEIQRLANARAAAARQQQQLAQHSARAPLPTGTLLVGAPAAPPAHAVEDARRIREAAAWAAHAQQEAQQRSGSEGGPGLAKRLDDMFSVIKTLPRGVSAEAEDWAAVAVAERAAAMRGSAGSGFSSGAAEAIAAAAAAREAAARDAGGAALRGAAAAAEAERARQRLAALRSSHPDAFPVMNPKALYTPWSDDSSSSAANGRSGASGLGLLDDDDDGEVETHLVARLLGARWRVRMAAALAVLTFGVYVRGEWAGWGVEGTAGGLLTWHAGDAAAVEGNHTHAHALSLVVRAGDADASSAGGSAPPLPPGAQPAEGLQAQAAAAVDAAKAGDTAKAAAKAAEDAAVALAEATATHAGEARRLLARTRQL